MPDSWTTLFGQVARARVELAAVIAWVFTTTAIGWVNHLPKFHERDRTTISGRIESVGVVPVLRKGAELELVLVNDPVRYRVESGIFADVLDSQPPEANQGALLMALVPVDGARRPISSASGAEKIVYVDELIISGQSVLALPQVAAWHAHDRRRWHWLIAVFFSIAVLLTLVAGVQRRIAKKLTP